MESSEDTSSQPVEEVSTPVELEPPVRTSVAAPAVEKKSEEAVVQVTKPSDMVVSDSVKLPPTKRDLSVVKEGVRMRKPGSVGQLEELENLTGLSGMYRFDVNLYRHAVCCLIQICLGQILTVHVVMGFIQESVLLLFWQEFVQHCRNETLKIK